MSPTTLIICILFIASFQNIGANDPYPDAVVSFWRMDSTGKEPGTFLGIGALIAPNCILIRSQLLELLRPLKTIGFYTGRSFYSHKLEESAIVDEYKRYKTLAFLIVKPGVYLQTAYTITNVNPLEEGQHDGYIIGWNLENGARRQPVCYRRHTRLELITQLEHSDFPGSSFIVEGTDIIAVSSIGDGRFTLAQVSVSPSLTIEKILRTAARFQQTDRYYDAAVSFWSLDMNRVPKKLIFMGALIRPNWILIPHEFYKMLVGMGDYAIDTGRKFENEKITEDSTNNVINFRIVNTKVIGDYARLIILVMKPGIRLPRPNVVTNIDVYGKASYSGDLVGWNFEKGAMSKKVTLSCFRGIYELKFTEGNSGLIDFPLGSFLVNGEDLIAFFLGIDHGQPNFLQLYRSESEAIVAIIESGQGNQLDCQQL